MRWTPAILLAFALLLGCAKQETTEPDPSTTGETATTATAQGPELATLGGALNSVGTRAMHPSIAFSDRPIVVWSENSKIVAAQWDGSAWQTMGSPLNRNADKQGQRPQIAVQPDKSVHVAWIESNPADDYTRVTVARWNGSAWEAVGDFVTPPGSVADSVRIAATQQGVVVVSRERVVPASERQVIVRRWNGSAWQQLGAGSLNAVAGSDATGEPEVAAIPNGDVVVVWIERVPGQPVVASGRRWDPAHNAWMDLPPIEGVDSDSTTAVAATSDVGAILSRTWNAGLQPLVELLPITANSWSEIGLPDSSLKLAGGIPSHRVAGTPNGGVVTVISTKGNLRVDALSEGKWSALVPAVNAEANRGFDPAVTVAPDGSIYIAYIDTRNDGAQLMVTSYRPAA